MQCLLHGSCACGRNRYVVEVPEDAPPPSSSLQVLLDNSSSTRKVPPTPNPSPGVLLHRPPPSPPIFPLSSSRTAQLTRLRASQGKHHASPLTAWLRVPLAWYRSATFAQYPDETPPTIRRTYVSPFPPAAAGGAAAPSARRQFCGYCGTHLSAWHERTPADAEHIALTLGSLLDEDVGALEALGVLEPLLLDDEPTPGPLRGGEVERRGHGGGAAEVGWEAGGAMDLDAPLVSGGDAETRALARETRPFGRGAPWFEDLVGSGALGRATRRHGGYGGDGWSVEWEVVEFEEGDAEADEEVEAERGGSSAKRKIGEVEGGGVEARAQ